MTVKILPAFKFNKAYPFEGCAMISVLNGESERRPERDDLLQLVFWDYEPCNESPEELAAFYAANGFTPKMAKQVKDFVLANIEKPFVVHCTAGQSRSGAIGEFVFDMKQAFGQPVSYEDFKRNNPQITPNWWVKKLLNQ